MFKSYIIWGPRIWTWADDTIMYVVFPNFFLQTEPIIEDMVLQQTMMQMKHQHILQQQLMEVHCEDL